MVIEVVDSPVSQLFSRHLTVQHLLRCGEVNQGYELRVKVVALAETHVLQLNVAMDVAQVVQSFDSVKKL